MFRRNLLSTACMLSVASVSHASGLLLYEYGSPDTGYASAGRSARADDASTIASNPAGMMRLEGHELLAGGAAVYSDISLSLDRDLTTFEGGSGGEPVGFVPAASVFYVGEGDERWKWGVGMYGNFGSPLEYDSDWAGRYRLQEVILLGLNIAPTVAYQLTDTVSVGLGVNFFYSIFEEKVGINNISLQDDLPDGRLKFEDTNWDVGANFGILYEPCPETRFGFQYTSSIEFDPTDRLTFENLGPILGAAVERNGLQGARLRVGLEVPQTAMISGYHQFDNNWAILGNIGWQDWSEFGLVEISLRAEEATSVTVDRGYEDTWHAAIGAETLVDCWKVSFGIAYDEGMLSDSNRTVDLPVGDEWRFGAGGRRMLSETMELGLQYTLRWNGDLDLDQEGGPLNGDVYGTYEDASAHFFSATINMRF